MATTVQSSAATVERLAVSAYEVPTEVPESDGTLAWDSTTMVLVEAQAGGETGLGFTYCDAAAAKLIDSILANAVEGCDALSPPAAWARMQERVRNAGRPGIAACAIAAVDVALWDLKARLLGLALADALPRFHDAVPVYGSGGFTSYSNERLAEQLSGWADQGIGAVKMKVGRDPQTEPGRLAVAREAIGDSVALMVDANGAYARKDALAWADRFADAGASWFEEPVSSDDLEGLHLLRDRGPAGLAIAAGEYGYDLFYFERMLEAGAVDVLQADVTRCGGITELIRVGALCKSRSLPFSGHTAPQIHAHACCAIESCLHVEYFHDHARIERLLFDGVLEPVGGELRPDRSRPGLGIELKRDDASRFAV